MAKEKIILTGDRPTGRLHIGHYVGSLRRRVELQNSGLYDKIFIFIADAQALTDNMENPEKVRQNVIEVALDYLACGLDPTKSTIFIQSQIPELCELTFYYMDLVTVSRLQRNPTVKTEIQMRNFETSIPVGFFTYPISQAADITAFRATTVPVAEVTETEVIVPDPDIAPRTVFFNIGSAEVSPREAMNLSYLADQMKQFPNATYTVNGYADSATGTPAFNKELSLKRAQAVVDVLVKPSWNRKSCCPTMQPACACRERTAKPR